MPERNGALGRPRRRPRPRPRPRPNRRRPRRARRAAKISAQSPRRNCLRAIAPAPAVIRDRRGWPRTGDSPVSRASCASTTPTAAKARRRWRLIWRAFPATHGRRGRKSRMRSRRVRRLAPTMPPSPPRRRGGLPPNPAIRPNRLLLRQRRLLRRASPQRADAKLSLPLRRRSPRRRLWRRLRHRSRQSPSGTFSTRSCSNKKPERDDDSKNSHPALADQALSAAAPAASSVFSPSPFSASGSKKVSAAATACAASSSSSPGSRCTVTFSPRARRSASSRLRAT